MKERPILFSASMVNAILDGRKTQTRRIMKPQPTTNPFWGCAGSKGFGFFDDLKPIKGPYGKPGDRLWVRETFGIVDSLEGARSFVYRAEGWKDPSGLFKWRPSIHMPRLASRIQLEITSVRVERLKAISEVDAVAEGAPCGSCCAPQEGSHKAGFAQLWESINGSGSWNANPWVWVIEFKRVSK